MARGMHGGVAPYMGHEKEPSSRGSRGGGGRGMHPPMHSHSARPKRHHKGGKKRGHRR